MKIYISGSPTASQSHIKQCEVIRERQLFEIAVVKADQLRRQIDLIRFNRSKLKCV